MSMMINSLLNETVNDMGITKPNEILYEVRKGIINSLKHPDCLCQVITLLEHTDPRASDARQSLLFSCQRITKPHRSFREIRLKRYPFDAFVPVAEMKERLHQEACFPKDTRQYIKLTHVPRYGIESERFPSRLSNRFSEPGKGAVSGFRQFTLSRPAARIASCSPSQITAT